MKKNRLSCIDFINSGLPNDGCCDSCHDDDELGLSDMCDLEPEGRSNTEAYICCAMRRAIEDTDVSLREVFTLALLALRKRMR